MNRNEFNRFIAGIDLPGPGDIEGLRELTALFPWFHSAHLVLLRGLRENSDIRFDSQLKASALSVNDREVLYHYLFLSQEEAAPAPEILEREEESATVADVTVPAETVTAREEEVAAQVEEVLTPPAEEMATPPVEDSGAPVEEVIAPAEAAAESVEEVTPQEEEVTPQEEEVTPQEEEVAPQEEEVTPQEEEVAPQKEEVTPQEVEVTSHAEEVTSATPDELQDTTGMVEEMPVQAEPEAGDVKQPEELPVQELAGELSEIKPDSDSGLRSREDLIAEIEARLQELESIHKAVSEEHFTEITDERVAAADITAEAIPEPEPEPETVQDTTPGSVPSSWMEEATSSVSETEEESEPEPVELLELIPDNVSEEEMEDQRQPEKTLSPADLIDRFIMISPTIERMSPKEYQPVRDLSDQGSEEPGKFITETLAKIYINQGYYTKAINIYEKLALQFPEKSAYFASRIEKIKDLIK